MYFGNIILKCISRTHKKGVSLCCSGKKQILRSVTSRFSTASESKPNCVVGTIGHIDHGKTTLTAAITKYCSKSGRAKYVPYDEIDKAPAEKQRGITIYIAHLQFETKNRSYSHIDCPGHADFVKNMIAGATQMDAAILVVAATDGQMPQTREHLLLAKQVGISKIIVFINKADIVDADMIELVEIEMREVLSSYGFNSESPIVVGSALLALQGDQSQYGEPAVQKLLDTLDSYVPVPQRDVDSPLLLPIDNALTVPGRGTVVIGTIKQGTVQKKDHLHLMGYDKTYPVVVGNIEIFHKSVDKAYAGDSVGLLIKGIKISDVKKGMAVCAEKSGELSNTYEAEIYVLTKGEGGANVPLMDNVIYAVFSETWTMPGKLMLKEELEMLLPGEHSTVTLTIKHGMVMPNGQIFTVRDFADKTLASGRVTKTLENSLVFLKKRFKPIKKPKIKKTNLEMAAATEQTG